MRKFVFLCAFLVLSFAAAAFAAGKKPSGLSTDYFSLDLAAGWEVLKSPRSPKDSLSILLGNKKQNCAVSINVMPANLNAQQIAKNTVANMRRDKVTVDDPIPMGKVYTTKFHRGKINGVSYFGANGKVGAVVSVFGDKLDSGLELVKRMQPKVGGLFPRF